MKIARCLLPAVLLLTGLASAQVFTLTDLGAGVFPGEVNNRGQFTASRNGVSGSFLWSKGTGFVKLDPLAGLPVTFVGGLNNRGDVVGFSEEEESDTFHATLWPDSGGAPIDLGSTLTDNSTAEDINDARQVTGDFGCCRSFLWTARSGLVDIGPPPAGVVAYEAAAISEDGTIVGSLLDNTSSTTFSWTKANGFKRIPVPSSFATGISRGFVIGASSCLTPSQCNDNNLHGFIWNRHFGTIDLGMLPGDNASYPSSINAWLLVVGASQNNSVGSSTAFLWVPGFGMIDLNKLVHAPGWVLNFATSINDRGQIVGYGTLNGDFHGFLLTLASRRR